MIHRLFAKASARLASERGETLVEVLIAILVSSLGMLMLANAIGASANIVRTGREATDAQYEAETKLADPASGSSVDRFGDTVKVKVDFNGVVTSANNPSGGVSDTPIDVTYQEEKIAGKDVISYEAVTT